MANTVFKLRRSSVAGKVPNTSTVAIGELAINLTDKKLFSSDGSLVFEIGANLTDLQVSNNITTSNINVTDTALFQNVAVFHDVAIFGAISANSSNGAAGLVLTSNGSGVYWAPAGGSATGPVRQQFTGDGNTTTFAISGGYESNTVSVFLNGVMLHNGLEANVQSGVNVVISPAPANGALIDVVGYSVITSTSYLTIGNTSISGNVISIGNSSVNTQIVPGNVYLNGSTLVIGNTSSNITIDSTTISIAGATINTSSFSGTANNTLYVGSVASNDVVSNTSLQANLTVIRSDIANSYSNSVNYTSFAIGTANLAMVANADAAYSNATSYTDSKIATANSAIVANASAAYSNSVSYTDTKIATANLAIANAYSNAVSYTDAQIGIANSSITSNASAAYSNAVSYTDSKIATANSEMAANVSAAYSNAVSYTDSKIATANSAIVANAGAAYSNATSYTDSKISTANSAIVANASAAYSNSVTYTDSKISTANSAMVANAATAYSNSVTYTDSKIATANAAITANASAAYSNATTYSSNASNVNTGTLAEARLPYRMNQNVRNTDSVTFNGMTLTGNLVVSGNVNIIGANNLSLVDNMIYLNANSTVTNPDLGFAGNYNDGTYRHTGFFRDATDGFWKVFDNYGPEPDASPYIDTSNSTFRIANFWANTIYVGNTSVYATVNTTNFTGTANNSSYLGGISKTQIFNNMGNYNFTYTDFNTIDDFGFRYVQGSTNGPGTGSSQFYGMTLGLGNEYAFSSYAYQIAFPRYLSTDNYISMRNREGGTWSSWTKIAAGVADAPSGSIFSASGSFRAPIFYDSDNTGYYVDLTSTGDSIISAGNIRLGSRLVFNTCDAFTGGSYALIGLSWGGAAGTYKNFAVYDYPNTRTMFTIDGQTRNAEIFGIAYAYASSRSPIFYDSDNTAYYVDPASGSNINTMSMAGDLSFGTNSGYGINLYGGNTGAHRIYLDTYWTIFKSHSNEGWKFRDNSNTDRVQIYGATGQIRIAANPSGWSAAPGLVVGYNGDGYLQTRHIWGKNTSNTGNDTLYLNYASGYGVWLQGTVNVNGTGAASADFRAPIFYDSDNTGYYVDPNNTSFLNYLNVGYSGISTLRPSGNWENPNFNALGANYVYYGYIGGGSNLPTSYGYPYGTFWDIFPGGAGGAQFYVSHAGNDLCFRGHWGNQANFQTWNRVLTDQIYSSYCNFGTNSVYGGIFYDGNDTGYYCNPNGTSVLATIEAGGLGRSSSHCIGSNLSGAIAWNNSQLEIKNTNGGNVGVAWHRAGYSSVALYHGAGSELRCSGNLIGDTDIRSPIFYDSNDTSYYCDPNSGSSLHHARFWGNDLYLRGGSPTFRFEDTDQQCATLHNNSNLFYILRHNNLNEGWSTVGSGWWPMTINLTNNNVDWGGDIRAAYNIIAYASDRRLKENIKEIPNAIEKIKAIRGVTFDWNDISEENGFVPERKYDDIGCIAQEVEAVLPHVVTLAPFDRWKPDPGKDYTDEELDEKMDTSRSGENYLTIQYERMVPLLIQAIKEQQEMIETMKQEMSDLKKLINS
jgi:hypothetical protein